MLHIPDDNSLGLLIERANRVEVETSSPRRAQVRELPTGLLATVRAQALRLRFEPVSGRRLAAVVAIPG